MSLNYFGDEKSTIIDGNVKWYDVSKGFGFIADDNGGPDVLLHANVLRTAGRSSVVEGVGISVAVQVTSRGLQAVKILAIGSPSYNILVCEEGESFDDLKLVPARVKWFDKVKGFGFANVFGDSEDVFIHTEVMLRCGISDLQPGEAISIKVVDGPRGKMASQIGDWNFNYLNSSDSVVRIG